MKAASTELDRLTTRFGSPLSGRVAVYVFPEGFKLKSITGFDCGGFAIWPRSVALVLREDNSEALRHENAHLFASRWSRNTPGLFKEGLCVWAQETNCGQAIDAVAKQFLAKRELTLSSMLKEGVVRRPDSFERYSLAGSFVRFLIRRLGFAKFRELYRACHGWRFRRQFQKCCGASFEEAESAWRTELRAWPRPR